MFGIGIIPVGFQQLGSQNKVTLRKKYIIAHFEINTHSCKQIIRLKAFLELRVFVLWYDVLVLIFDVCASLNLFIFKKTIAFRVTLKTVRHAFCRGRLL